MALFLTGIWGTILWIISVLCIVWIIYDVLTKNKKLSTGVKIIWIVIALLLNQYSIIAAIIYYLIYKK